MDILSSKELWIAIVVSTASFLGLRWQVIRKEKSDKLSLLRAIYAELKTLRQLYTRSLGPALTAIPEGECQIVDMVWPGGHHYFQVYTQNTNLIGNVDNNEIRDLIIETYLNAIGLVDSIKLNTDMLLEFKKLETKKMELGIEGIPVNEEFRFQKERLEEYGYQLRNRAEIFINKCDDLLALLEPEIKKFK